MKDSVAVPWLATALLLSVCCTPGAGEQSVADTSPGSAEVDTTDDLGNRIAGTWLGTFEVDGSDSPPTPFISTYHPDGTAVTTSSRMFGGSGADGKLSSTQHVQWEAEGPRSIRWRLLHFGHDADGKLVYVSRTHGRSEFDETFEESRGTFEIEVFAPDSLVDPLDPNNPDGRRLGTGTSVARRLRVRIPGE